MRRAGFVTVLAWALLATAAGAQEKQKVAVLEFAAKSGVTQDQADVLNDLVANAIRKYGEYQVVTTADIQSMLGLERAKEAVGCSDVSCLSEIGGALGVDLIVSGNLGQFAELFLVNLRLVDAHKAESINGITREVTGGQGALPAAVRAGVAELFGKDASAAAAADATAAPETAGGEAASGAPAGGESGGQPAATAEPDEPIGFYDWAPWVALGLGVALAAGGGAVAYMASEDDAAMDDETRGTTEWQDLKDSGESKALTADVLFGVGGALAVTGIVLLVVGLVSEDEPAAAAGVVPTHGGAVVSLGGVF